MKSNVCKLIKNKECLNNILEETEKALNFIKLEKHEALRIRLLSEEMVCLVGELIDDFEGEFWLETKGDKLSLCASLEVSYMDKSLKDRLLKLSSNNKNNFAKGIKGRILAAFESLALSIAENGVYIPSSIGYNTYEEYSENATYTWSLNDYKEEVVRENKTKKEEWDELEKSIIAKLADNVLVGVRKDKVEIIIVKKIA